MKKTINEMILATLNTRMTREPKYKKELEKEGYVIFDSTWSSMGNWSVKKKNIDTFVVRSRDYGNNIRYYRDCSDCIETNDIKKVDFENLLSHDSKEPLWKRTEIKKSKYAIAREEIKYAKQNIELENYWLEKALKELEKAKHEVERQEKYIAESIKRLEDARALIK